MAKEKVKAIKKAAWTAFSNFIRHRDCLITTGDTEWGGCITCGRLYKRQQLQAGHFIPGRLNAILFDEQCTHAQCYGCNVPKNGNGVEYYKAMLELYDQELIDSLRLKSKQIVKLDADDYRSLRDFYITQLKRLKSSGLNDEEERLKNVYETSSFFNEQLANVAL